MKAFFTFYTFGDMEFLVTSLPIHITGDTLTPGVDKEDGNILISFTRSKMMLTISWPDSQIPSSSTELRISLITARRVSERNYQILTSTDFLLNILRMSPE